MIVSGHPAKAGEPGAEESYAKGCSGVQISIFPQRCQVNVESNLCFYNSKILQSNLKLKLQSRRNCNEVIPKLSQPLELNKGDPEANSKSLFFSEEMKASRMSEEKERRSYAGRHLMIICR